MAEKKRLKSRKKARVRKTGYVIAAFVTAIFLGAVVWLTMDLVSSKEPENSVPLKKTPTTTGTSVVTAPENKSLTTVQSEKTEHNQPVNNTVKVDAVKLENKFEITAQGVSFSWEKSNNATGYNVYRINGTMTDLIATIENADECSFTDSRVSPGNTYNYSVTAFARSSDATFFSESSNVITFEYPQERLCDNVNLYLLPRGTQIYKDVGGKLQLVNTLSEEGYYTGLPDEKHKGYVAIDYMLETAYVKDSIRMVNGAVALPTSVIGQEGGQIVGVSACGPVAAVVIVRYDKGDLWNKDDCIRFAEANKLCDQGSMMGKVGDGGMSAPFVIKFIEKYSQGRYTASNVYSDDEKPSETLRKMIDKGVHSILSVRYAWGIVHHPYSIVHFVEPSAYTIEDGKLFFYYGDTSYGNGPKGLVKVSAEELDLSVSKVHEEPKCIIVLSSSGTEKPAKTDAQ